jgi:hypothetical protein
MTGEYGCGARLPREDLMTWKILAAKIPAAHKVAVSLAAVAMIAIVSNTAGAQSQTPTTAQKPPKRQLDDRGRAYYGPSGPNVSYQQGPNTRIYITKRSWLDAGVEVLPGDRKFTDYAFPPEYAVGSGRIPDEIPATLKARQTIVPTRVGTKMRVSAQACSLCSSFKIASPICAVDTAVAPSDLMSAVRRPLASTAAMAASTLSASDPMSKE